VLVVGALLVWRRRYPLVISTSAVLIQLLMPWFGPSWMISQRRSSRWR
jgi:hypothetical protein